MYFIFSISFVCDVDILTTDLVNILGMFYDYNALF